MSRPLIKRQDKKIEPPPILQFQGYYEFLSIDYSCWVYHQGFLFPSIATAFQAARTNDAAIRRRVSQVKEHQQLKKIMAEIKNTPDWPQRRTKVMEQLNRDKFKRNKDLGLKLFATQKRKLVNGYSKGGEAEAFWGAIEQKGQFQGLNTLGKILTTIREQIQSGGDSPKWIEDQNIQTDAQLWPEVNIIAQKQEGTVDTLPLRNSCKFIFGWGQQCDFKLNSASTSRFHASIYFSADMEVVLVDLNSSQGVKILRRGQQIKLQALRPESLENGDVVLFGSSLSRYILDINYESVEAKINQKRLQASEQLERIEKLKQLQAEAAENEQKLILQRNKLQKYSCLYVEGINRNFTYKDIKETFNQYGLTRNIRINIDQKTGRFMGSVLVYYDEKIKISEVLQNIKKHPIKYEFRVVAVTAEEAEKIIATFTSKDVQQKQRKQAEQNQKQRSIASDKRGREISTKAPSMSKKREERPNSSSSSSDSPSSNSRSRSRSKRRHDRSHNK